MSKQAKFKDLINLCNKFGWDNIISELEKIVLHYENIQAHLFSGTPQEVRQAVKLRKTIIKQNLTIAKLKEYRKKHGL
jgi:hypothetical protein